ncbi:MAG: hypothetical protein ACD_72C00336G0001 [uncultured bacterium]|nr:MAG: hypothetical protein ACD_72C00336G0001 [uncultured bacterium]
MVVAPIVKSCGPIIFRSTCESENLLAVFKNINPAQVRAAKIASENKNLNKLAKNDPPRALRICLMSGMRPLSS